MPERCEALADFAPVMRALDEHTRATGAAPRLVSGWEPDDPAIAPPAMLARTLQAIRPRLDRYAYSRDFAEARELAATILRDDIHLGAETLAAERIAIASSSSQALFLALLALADRGVHWAVIAAPVYHAVVAMCHRAGMATTVIPACDIATGALDVPRLAAAAQRGPSVVIVTNPAYSVGVEYAPADLEALCAALPAHATLLLDETRLGLHWRRPEPWPALRLPTRALIVRSPSKLFWLNGLKMALLIGPSGIVRQAERIGEMLLGSVAGNAEAVALEYLYAWQMWHDESYQVSLSRSVLTDDGPLSIFDGERVVGEANTVDESLLAWRAGVVAALQRNLLAVERLLHGSDFRLSPVDSGPYALAYAPRQAVADLDCRRIAREHGILVMTSHYFYHQHPEWTGFRINLAAGVDHVCGVGDLSILFAPRACLQKGASMKACIAMK
jgi:aspartate/methionine/tyrosine aminotransferase